MAQSAAVDVRGCKINVRRSGRGEPLLFLHGAQGLRRQRASGLDALAQRFDVIAPDHPGFGLLRRQSIRSMTSATWRCSISTFSTLLKLDSVHVVGQCIGGWLALEMAMSSSARFRSLVLVNSAGIRIKGVPRGDMFVCSEAELLKLLFAGDGAADEWLESGGPRPTWKTSTIETAAAAAKYSWSPRLCNPKLDRWLHRVDVATHIIWGKEDRVIPPAYAEALNGS